MGRTPVCAELEDETERYWVLTSGLGRYFYERDTASTLTMAHRRRQFTTCVGTRRSSSVWFHRWRRCALDRKLTCMRARSGRSSATLPRRRDCDELPTAELEWFSRIDERS